MGQVLEFRNLLTVEVLDMPLCPLCDNPVFANESFVLGVVNGVCGLVHSECAANEGED